MELSRETPQSLCGKRRIYWPAVLLIGLISGNALGVHAAPQDDLKRLVEQRNFKQAFELGRANADLLGTSEFDFWFGLAAIDSGNATEGVLALERFLLANPDSANGRLELGRGYFVMGDMARAKAMFDEASRLNPPPVVVEQIARYQAAIRARQSGARASVGGFLEAGFGRDSNVNGGVTQDTINLPFIGLVTLTEDGRAKSDSYSHLAGGIQANMPLGPSWNLFGGLGADGRQHRDSERFDQRNAALTLGAGYKRNDAMWRFSINAAQLDVSGDRYRDLKAGTVEWIQSPADTRGFSAFAQLANIGFEGDNRVRDARLAAAGFGWRQPLVGNWQPSIALGLQAGREQNRRERDDLGRNFAGVRASLNVVPGARTAAGLSLNVQSSRYREADAFFATTRSDRFAALDVFIAHYLTAAVSLKLELSRHQNRSNIDLYDFTRNQAALKLRYEFK